MPDPATSRLGLYKSKSDGSELVNYTQDLGQNWDKVDLAVGFQSVTSSTRPSSPYSGKAIMQSDTGYSTLFHNGTSPASGGWVEIPNSSAAYSGRLVTLFPGSTSSASQMRLAQTGAAAGNRALATRGSGDTVDHFFFDYDGKLQWGAGGSSAADVNLYRSGANVLATDDSLTVAGDLTVQGHDRGRGIRGSVSRTTTITFSSETVIMTVPSMTWVAGRAYRLTIWGYIQAPTASYALLKIRKGTTTSGTLYVDGIRLWNTTVGNADGIVSLTPILVNATGSDITTAVSLCAVQGSIAQTWTWDANATTLASYITVEDIGLATDWPGTPIS